RADPGILAAAPRKQRAVRLRASFARALVNVVQGLSEDLGTFSERLNKPTNL
ncbi:MAG: hypothetical protein HY077_05405, partial [Elusimicrobia bacterium]|nr:hypothetical protein [Elusimicrobiota bacterium]